MSYWLGFQVSIALTQVQFLVRELRFCKLQGAAKKKRHLNTAQTIQNLGKLITYLTYHQNYQI